MGMNLTRNGLIVLISVIFVAGAGTAYAIDTITFDGDVMVDGSLDVSGQITGPTITDLDNRIIALEGG